MTAYSACHFIAELRKHKRMEIHFVLTCLTTPLFSECSDNDIPDFLAKWRKDLLKWAEPVK